MLPLGPCRRARRRPDALPSRRGGRSDVDADADALVKAGKDRHQPIHGEAAEVGVADARKIGGGVAGDRGGFPDRQLALVQDADDTGGQERPQLVEVGGRPAEIPANSILTTALLLVSNYRLPG